MGRNEGARWPWPARNASSGPECLLWTIGGVLVIGFLVGFVLEYSTASGRPASAMIKTGFCFALIALVLGVVAWLPLFFVAWGSGALALSFAHDPDLRWPEWARRLTFAASTALGVAGSLIAWFELKKGQWSPHDGSDWAFASVAGYLFVAALTYYPKRPSAPPYDARYGIGRARP